mmetsp:Transcript_27100/g.78636  ORF Transcript_27100/g.78636 Transcript_27100/m.78636 type:complete len:258 (-) Transcript_27100:71-844(-)
MDDPHQPEHQVDQAKPLLFHNRLEPRRLPEVRQFPQACEPDEPRQAGYTGEADGPRALVEGHRRIITADDVLEQVFGDAAEQIYDEVGPQVLLGDPPHAEHLVPVLVLVGEEEVHHQVDAENIVDHLVEEPPAVMLLASLRRVVDEPVLAHDGLNAEGDEAHPVEEDGASVSQEQGDDGDPSHAAGVHRADHECAADVRALAVQPLEVDEEVRPVSPALPVAAQRAVRVALDGHLFCLAAADVRDARRAVPPPLGFL